MDKLRKDMIRARYNEAFSTLGRSALEASYKDVPVLLEALEAETARANANRDEAILIDQNSADKDRYFEEYKAKLPSIIRGVLESQLFGTLHCTRCWSAWSYGTMKADDFVDVDIDEIVDAVVEALGGGADATN